MMTVTTLPRSRPLTWRRSPCCSPRTPRRLIDLDLKKARFEAAGCPSYWVVDPDRLELTAWELVDGIYVEVAHVSGEEPFGAAKPFPLTVVPADLLD